MFEMVRPRAEEAVVAVASGQRGVQIPDRIAVGGGEAPVGDVGEVDGRFRGHEGSRSLVRR